MDRDVLRLKMTVYLSSKDWDRVRKSLEWSLDSFETQGCIVQVTLCAGCVAWAHRDKLPKLLISTSVIFWCYCYE